MGVLIVGLIARICLLFFGEWQDRTMEVKYTDVDYLVFTDAAEFVSRVIITRSIHTKHAVTNVPLLTYSLID